MGRLRRQVRKVWPSFRVDVEPSLRLRGVPEGGKLARKYIVATWQRNWKRRQERILQARPTANQQDYLLYKILLEMTSDRVDGSLICTTEAILPDVNSISHVALQTMLRFLGGMTDFARVNAHKPRWSSLPGLRESDIKRCCLFCWMKRGVKVLDTEWHCIFDCPVNLAPRRHFRLALQINKVNSRKVKFQSADVRQRIAIASDLAVLVANCRSDEQLVRDLARFVVDSIACRQRAFRKLSVRDVFPT